MKTRSKPKAVAPRIPNIIADEIRDRILSGEIEDGSFLSKQEGLMDEFNVSPPSIREALRILETQGLVTILRGKNGGSIVHAPNRHKAAYTIASVLQSKNVPLSDVSNAIQTLEPLCCELAAKRKNRKREIIPKLRKYAKESEAAIDDPEKFRECSARFHQELINSSGNETLILLAGALESLWVSHAAHRAATGNWAIPVKRSHRVQYSSNSFGIIEAIESGDGTLARKRAEEHLKSSTRHTLTDDSLDIHASWLSEY